MYNSTFTHIDNCGNPTMVDVGEKAVTERMAWAQGEIQLPEEVLNQLKNNEIQTKKGPVIQTSIIAGTMGVKKTSEIIPFCHPLNLEGIKIHINIEGHKAIIDCRVNLKGKTGVEMEALTGVTTAALTFYDMCKAISHELVIGSIKLIEKTGGKRDIRAKE